MQHGRDWIREFARRSRLLLDPKWVAEDLSRFLGGWVAYFGFGNSAIRFGKIRRYAQMRLALFISKRSRRSREFGWSVVAFQSPDQLGLTVLPGIVVDPQAVCGKPNARFKAAGTGKRAEPAKDTLGWHMQPGNRRPRRPQALKPASHRASPDPS